MEPGRPGTQVSVLGGCRISVNGSPVELRPQERALLSSLALFAPEAVPVDRLAELLWDEPPATARKAIQNHVLRIRQSVGADIIETSADGYRLGGSVSRDVIDIPLALERAGPNTTSSGSRPRRTWRLPSSRPVTSEGRCRSWIV